MSEPEQPPALPDISIPPEWVPGVYANLSVVAYGQTEFTIDFIRMDPYDFKGTVVARVSIPHQTAITLSANLNERVQAWARQAMAESGGGGNGQTTYRPEDGDPDAPA